MSAGEIAGLIAACAFVVLVALLALPLVRLTGAIEAARRSVERLTEEAVPTLRGTATTVESVNASLGQAEGITTDVHDMSTNINGLTALVATAVGGPLVRVSALSYGVRRALAHRRVEQAVAAPRRGADRAAVRAAARGARRGSRPEEPLSTPPASTSPASTSPASTSPASTPPLSTPPSSTSLPSTPGQPA